MITSRQQHTTTLLADGTVMAVGGTSWTGGIVPLASAEIYDPATNRWRTTGALHQGRYYHTATLLSSGQVLVAGGDGGSNYTDPLASAEIYDPTTGQWRTTGSMHTARAHSIRQRCYRMDQCWSLAARTGSSARTMRVPRYMSRR